MNNSLWAQQGNLTPAIDDDRIGFGATVLLEGDTAFVLKSRESANQPRANELGVFVFDLSSAPEPGPDPEPGLVRVSFLSDSDGSYVAQHTPTRLIECFAPAICDVPTGRYRLVGFDDFKSVYVTVEYDGSVRFTYDGRLDFPFAVAG